MSQEEKRKIFFLHIPKTGGTSLLQFLGDRFDHRKILPDDLARSQGEYKNSENPVFLALAPSYDLIHGHFDYGVYGGYFSDHFLITFLREPKRRIISLYNDFQTKSGENYHNASPEGRELISLAQSLSLKDFLLQDNHIIKELFYNAQVGQIAGDTTGARSITKAIKNLEKKNTFVGYMETFQESMEELCSHFGWLLPEKIPHKNLSRGKLQIEDIDQETYDVLAEFTYFDQKLYDHFLTGKSCHIPSPQSKILPRVTHENPYFLSMDQALSGDNWHEREGTGTGKVWRWTGPGRTSTLHAYMSKGTYRCVLKIISCFDTGDLDKIVCGVEGKMYTFRYIGMYDGEHILETNFDLTMDTKHPIKLSIITPSLRSQSDMDKKNEDTRRKGVAITSMSIYGI